MNRNGPLVTMGGTGSVPSNNYKPKGLRNKRKAHWAQIRKTAQMLKENRERELLRGEQQDFDDYMED